MVLVADQRLVRQASARRSLAHMLSQSVVEATERANGEVDWPRLQRCLDTVYLIDGGGLAQWSFLNKPLKDLAGRTPAEMLQRPDGPDEVMRATRAYARRRAHSIKRSKFSVGVR